MSKTIEAASPSLMSDFEAVWQTAYSYPNIPLEPINPKIFNFDKRAAMFDSARQLWTNAFDDASLLRSLDKIDSKGITPETRQLLKSTRKYALVMTGAYVLFDTQHLPPESHYRFSKTLGKFNDEYPYPKPVTQQALIETITNMPPLSRLLTFQPASDEDFTAELGNILKTAADIVRLEPQLIKKVHDLRKNLRFLMNGFRLSVFMTNDPVEYAYLNKLIIVNEELGSIHDRVLQRVNSDQSKYESTQVQIKPKTYITIQQILESLAPLSNADACMSLD